MATGEKELDFTKGPVSIEVLVRVHGHGEFMAGTVTGESEQELLRKGEALAKFYVEEMFDEDDCDCDTGREKQNGRSLN